MITKILYKIVPDFFIDSIKNRSFNEGVRAEKERQEENKNRSNEIKLICFETDNPIGSMIISMPNEEVNPVLGKIIRYEFFGHNSTPFVVVYDYISQKEFTLMSKAYQYTDEMLSALMKMTAQERHVVFYGHTKTFSDPEPLIPDLKSMKDILTKNGFYSELDKYKASQNA